MHVFEAGVHGSRGNAGPQATQPDEALGRCGNDLGQNPAAICREPDQLGASLLVRRAAGLSDLQAAAGVAIMFRAETVSIHSVDHAGRALKARMREAQTPAARRWNDVKAVHLLRRTTMGQWPTRDELERHTKGRYKLHAQSFR